MNWIVIVMNIRDVGSPLQDLEISYRPLELRSLIEQCHAERRIIIVRNIERHSSDVEIQYLDVQVTEDQKEDIQIITQEIDRLTETTQKFLDFTKTSRVQFESVQISAPIESALKTLQPKIKQKNILVRINHNLKSHFVEIDPSQVEQLKAKRERALSSP